jgi:hypothetical protein
MILLDLQYLAPIEYYALMAQVDEVMIEACENYQKGSYRNRCYLAGPNGSARLSIPLQKGKHQRKKYKEVTVSPDEPWSKIHWQSLASCYRSSPYFEYYEDQFEPIFQDPPDKLFELNRSLMDLIVGIIGIEAAISYTESWERTYEDLEDLRMVINPRNQPKIQVDEYIQVFASKTGFIQPVSIVDLLFNEGPATLDFLQKINLSPLRS